MLTFWTVYTFIRTRSFFWSQDTLVSEVSRYSSWSSFISPAAVLSLRSFALPESIKLWLMFFYESSWLMSKSPALTGCNMMSEGPLVMVIPWDLDLIYGVISESAQKSHQQTISHTLMLEGHFLC